MIPHARNEITALAQHSAVVSLAAVQGWNIQKWQLTPKDVERSVAAYQALLSIELEDDLEQLLIDMGVNRLGPRATSNQHAKVARADAIELLATATVVSVDAVDLDDLHMPNVPKMAGPKSDSGIDVIGVELNPAASGDIVDGERLLLVSVKHTVNKYASDMRGKLEKSVTSDLSGPYLYRQLHTLHGRMVQSGTDPTSAKRIFKFMRETLVHPHVRVICVAAATPPPGCNLPDQPDQLAKTDMPDAHFRMLLVPDLATLHEKLIP